MNKRTKMLKNEASRWQRKLRKKEDRFWKIWSCTSEGLI